MNWIQPIAELVVSIAVPVTATVLFSLRRFSRKKLEDLCCRHRRPERFGEILKLDDRILFAADILFAAFSFLFLTWPVAGRLPESMLHPAGSSTTAWLTTVCGWLAGMGLFAAFAVVLPLLAASLWSERLLYHFWPVIRLFGVLTVPVRSISQRMDRMAHRLFSVPYTEPDLSRHLTQEIRSVVEEGKREGLLEAEATSMIHRVMDLHFEDVAAIMTPRTDMTTLPADSKIADAVETIRHSRFSRIPLTGRTVDDIRGILYARELLAYVISDEPQDVPLSEIARPPFFVPETKGIDDLLQEMRQRKVHMAIVVDEYSGVAGLVTLEDVLEEIVGEIEDEFEDDTLAMFETGDDGSILVDARTHVDELNQRFSLQLPEDPEYDTVGGFVMSITGRIPVKGESHSWKHLEFEVVSADERHIEQLRIIRHRVPSGHR